MLRHRLCDVLSRSFFRSLSPFSRKLSGQKLTRTNPTLGSRRTGHLRRTPPPKSDGAFNQQVAEASAQWVSHRPISARCYRTLTLRRSTGRLRLAIHMASCTLWLCGRQHAHSQPRSSLPRWHHSAAGLRALSCQQSIFECSYSSHRCPNHNAVNLYSSMSRSRPSSPRPVTGFVLRPAPSTSEWCSKLCSGFGEHWWWDTRRSIATHMEQNEAYDVAAGVTHCRTYWLAFTW